MIIYFDKEFTDYYLSKSAYISKGDCFVNTLLTEYSEISVFIEGDNTQENYSNSYFRLRFNIGNDSRTFSITSNFIQAIGSRINDNIALIFTGNKETNFGTGRRNLLYFNLDNYETKIESFLKSSSFKFIINKNNDWEKLNLTQYPLNLHLGDKIVILDPYIFSNYFTHKKDEYIENPFLKFLNKIVPEDTEVDIQVVTVTEEFDHKTKSLISHRKSVNSIFEFLQDVFIPGSKMEVLDNGKSDRTSRYNFHDRNIFTNFFIIKVGIGFSDNHNDFTNSEVECYSVFDKWGYDLIRHRKKMLSSYLGSIVRKPSRIQKWEFNA